MVEPARKVVVDLVVGIDPALPEPLHRQVYRALRSAMLEQRLKAGAKLPSTRALAQMLGVARNTIHGAYDQLLAEGYLEARHGSGTYVAASLPDEAFKPGPAPRSVPPGSADIPSLRSGQALSAPGKDARTGAAKACPDVGAANIPALEGRSEGIAALPGGALPGSAHLPGRLSSWGQRVASIGETPYLGGPVSLPYDFRHGRPDATHFPLEAWRRIAGRQLRQLDRDDLWYGPAAGLPALRTAISEYLGRARGVRCTPEQVIITNGTQQAIDLMVRLLIDPGDVVVVEDPCYSGARRVFAAQGACLIDVPVDEHGLCVDLLPDAPARLVYTTPSHQYPSGATLPVSRRLDLLRWAERHDALIVEDDYDSEFRHAGRPLEALQGLDRSGRVAYVGSFSKVLYPALRLGYLVAPVDLVRLAAEAKRLVDLQTATPGQELLAELIQGGHFEAHLRRMRRVYRGRRAALLDALARALGPLAEAGPSDAGLYLRVVLAEGIDEDAVTREAAARGVAVYPARPYYQRPPERPGLILGYAALDEDGIREGIRRLREAIEAVSPQVSAISGQPVATEG